MTPKETHVATKRRNIFYGQPVSEVQTKTFLMENYGQQHFFPRPDLQKGLKRVVVFTESSRREDVPSGSFWTYSADTPYNPEFLKDSVGCGITAFLIEDLPIDRDGALEILRAVEDSKVRVGRGNHFIEICGPPSKYPEDANFIFVHSHASTQNRRPQTFSEAIDKVKRSREARIKTLENVTRAIGIRSAYFDDWTHNAIEVRKRTVTYRKGVINVRESSSEGHGILVLDSFGGIYFYTSLWENYQGRMQHGTGLLKVGNGQRPNMTVLRSGPVIGHLYARREMGWAEDYFSMNEWMSQFRLEHLWGGIARTKLIIYAY